MLEQREPGDIDASGQPQGDGRVGSGYPSSLPHKEHDGTLSEEMFSRRLPSVNF